MSDPTLEGRLRWEQRARSLLQWGALESTRAASSEAMLQALLREVCRATGWPVGHVLQLDDAGQLVSAALWHVEDKRRFDTFREVTSQMRFPPGIGLPGRVLSSGRPHWITDIAADENFPRKRVAVDIG